MKVSEPCSTDGVQVNVRPFQAKQFANSQACIKHKQGRILKWWLGHFEIQPFLGTGQNEFAVPLPAQEPGSVNAVNYVPFIRRTKQPAQSCQFTVYAGWADGSLRGER